MIFKIIFWLYIYSAIYYSAHIIIGKYPRKGNDIKTAGIDLITVIYAITIALFIAFEIWYKRG